MVEKTKKNQLTASEIKDLYYKMVLIRKMEDKCFQLYSMGHIAGFLHLYIGQEAIVTSCNYFKKPQDSHITSYRCHAHALLCGQIDIKHIFAELLGRKTGCSKGKGGSMHLYSKEHNFYGGNGIVGAQVPLGTGCALAHQYTQDGGINFCYMGDGAMPQGQVYEAFNMAALWKLPVLYIIENNQYSMGTSLERTHANTKLFERGPAFGIPSDVINGMDIMELIPKIRDAVEFVRAGNGPYLLEVITYRYKGHSMSDPQKYRSKDEVDNFRLENDPILNLKNYIMQNKLSTENDLKEIDKQIKDEIKQAEDFALNSDIPDLNELYTEIFCG